MAGALPKRKAWCAQRSLATAQDTWTTNQLLVAAADPPHTGQTTYLGTAQTAPQTGEALWQKRGSCFSHHEPVVKALGLKSRQGPQAQRTGFGAPALASGLLLSPCVDSRF